MQVYGLVGQTEEGIWPEAQLNICFLGDRIVLDYLVLRL